MALTPQMMDSVLINTPSVVLNAGASGSVVSKVLATNTDATDHNVTVYRTGQGVSPGTGNIVVDAYPVGAGKTVPLPLSGMTLLGTVTLQAVASTASVVNLSLSWYNF